MQSRGEVSVQLCLQGWYQEAVALPAPMRRNSPLREILSKHFMNFMEFDHLHESTGHQILPAFDTTEVKGSCLRRAWDTLCTDRRNVWWGTNLPDYKGSPMFSCTPRRVHTSSWVLGCWCVFLSGRQRSAAVCTHFWSSTKVYRGCRRSLSLTMELLMKTWQAWTYEMAKGRAFRVRCPGPSRLDTRRSWTNQIKSECGNDDNM